MEEAGTVGSSSTSDVEKTGTVARMKMWELKPQVLVSDKSTVTLPPGSAWVVEGAVWNVAVYLLSAAWAAVGWSLIVGADERIVETTARDAAMVRNRCFCIV